MPRPVSIVTVTYDTYFFVRLLVEQVRAQMDGRGYEIVAVDRGSRDETCDWLGEQTDVRLLTVKPQRRGHGHGEAAEFGVASARHDHIVLLDSDAHPCTADWLTLTVDRLDEQHRLAGGIFHGQHKSNPRGWYIHPHFMAFAKRDLGEYIVLRKSRGRDLDTGEDATIRVLDAGLDVIGYPIEFCERFAVGHPHFPTVTAGVFHAWYGTRLGKDVATVAKETSGAVTAASYLEPLQARLRAAYNLSY